MSQTMMLLLALLVPTTLTPASNNEVAEVPVEDQGPPVVLNRAQKRALKRR